MTPVLTVACAVLLACCAGLWKRQRRLKREDHIRHFELPRGLFDRLRKHHPHLSPKECQLVAQGLRQFFLAHLKSGRRHVSMPSQAADDLWHEFILHTRNYEVFCRRAFGRFMHHTPAAVLGPRRQRSNEGLRRCWRYACLEENINPRAPARLPLLFALDAKLAIAGGFVYAADCAALRDRQDGTAVYCGGDFSDASVDGSTDGFDDATDGDGAGDGDGGGHAGGDGGGGDGGGCSGGGD